MRIAADRWFGHNSSDDRLMSIVGSGVYIFAFVKFLRKHKGLQRRLLFWLSFYDLLLAATYIMPISESNSYAHTMK